MLTEKQLRNLSVEDIVKYIVSHSSYNDLLYMVQYGNKEFEKK